MRRGGLHRLVGRTVCETSSTYRNRHSFFDWHSNLFCHSRGSCSRQAEYLSWSHVPASSSPTRLSRSQRHCPPAYIAGPDGTPWHSWRVLILPFIGEESVYEQYRFDELWNGPNNRLLADKITVEYFQCPSGPDFGRTLNANFVAVVGSETIFPGSNTTMLTDMKDGKENTALLVKIGNSDIHWMEPRDLYFKSLEFEPDPKKASSANISSHHPAGPGVIFADKITPYRLRKPLSDSALRSLFTIDGGESFSREDLDRSIGSSFSE